MRILPFALLSVTALGLAACAPGTTGIRCGTGDGGRAAIGAIGGALAADLLDENALTGGVDYGSYPLARTYTVGLNIGF